jgi:eukaryotic-like serine/threonine-protein kinase
MGLNSGTKLGPYEIVSPLGSGGMGEVYRARDTRLDRTVAIKVLPESLKSDFELKARFDREARAISSLQHPHICALFDVGHQDDIFFLVMEYLDGETLANRLLRGALPLEQVLKIGSDLADALAKAHSQGIVHRDVKPGNIMLTKTGTKLMDFGLARGHGGLGSMVLPGAAGGPLTPSTPTVTLTALASAASPLTQKGMIVGTFQYLAPEVLQGNEADARSDIFAAGCVLYEMATGKRAFEGKTQLSVMTAILEKDPEPISTLQPLAPVALGGAIRTCLNKNPDERWQTAADLRNVLSLVNDTTTQGRTAAPAGKSISSKWKLLGALAVLLLVVAAAVIVEWLHRAPASPVLSSELNLPAGTILDTLNDSVAVSPDGRALALALLKGDGTSQLWIRQLGTGQTTAVPGTVGAAYPFWSPDGASLAFFAGGKIMRVDLASSATQAVCEAPQGRGGTWNQAGRIVFSPGLLTGLFEVPATGGTPTDLAIPMAANDSLRVPRFLPDGDHVLFLRFPMKGPSHIEVLSLTSKRSSVLLQADAAAQYSTTGQLLLVRGSNLFAQDFDPGQLRLSGQPAVITGVQVDPARRTAAFSVSNSGLLVYAPGGDVPLKQLQWIDSSGKAAGNIGPPAGYYYEAELSPNDKLAVALGQNYELTIIDLATGTRKPFSLASTPLESDVVWSPDGKWLAYTAELSDKRLGIHIIATDGRTQSKLVYTCPTDPCAPSSWSRDGKMLALEESTTSGGDNGLTIISVDDGRKLYSLPHASQGKFSPDGKWLLFDSAERGKSEVYVTAIPPGPEKWRVTSGGGNGRSWPMPGTIFYTTNEDKIASVAVSSQGKEFHVGESEIKFAGRSFPSDVDWDLSHDGKRVLAAVPTESNSNHTLRLVQNWAAALKR